MRICMLVTTDVTNDPRVMKEATALIQAGYSVHVIGICRTGTEPFKETIDGITIQRLLPWHIRFSIWMKSVRGIKPTQGFFVGAASGDTQKHNTWHTHFVNIVHQVQFIIHIVTIIVMFFRATLHQHANVYHAHDVDTLLPGLLAGWWNKSPVIYDSHEYWYLQRLDQSFSNALIRFIECIGTPQCSQVITVNHSIAEKLVTHYRIPMPTIIMNVPVHTPVEPPLPLQDAQVIQLLYHGGYAPSRGLEMLIDAMALVKAPIHLTMRGYGSIELALRTQVESLDIQEKVTFAPPVPMKQLVQSAHRHHVGIALYSVKDNTYSLGNKFFEYMSAGLALLVTDLPEPAAIVRKHDIGVVCNVEDPAILAQTIDNLANDRDYLEYYRQRSWHVFQEHYHWDKHKQILLDVYARVYKVSFS